jgi:signal transduction histidine kinase
MKQTDPSSRIRKLYQETLDGLDAVQRVGEILGETFEEDEICRKAVQVFVRHLPFENCSVLLLDKGKGVLRLRAAAGKADEQRSESQRKALNRNLEIRVGEGVAGEVVRTGKPVLIPDVGRNPQFKSIPSPIPIRSLLCMPLFSKEEIIGVMNLSHPEIEEISADQERILEVLSRMVGQAITISRLNAELIAERLRRSERLASLGQLTASVAHEVNNPLTNVLLRAQKLQMSKSLEEGDRKMAAEIEEEAEKIAGILGSLLDFSRARKPKFHTTDVNQTMLRVLELTAPLQTNRTRIRTRIDLSPDLPEVNADPTELEQVFTNLMINAVQAIEGGGEITVATRATGDSVEIRVGDTGCGMNEEQKKMIFEPFFTTRVESGGTGLGLAVSRQIVRSYLGELTVESEPGQGSVFSVVLPLPRKASQPAPPA